MSRSCHRETFSSAATALPRSTRASPRDLLALDRVALVGHGRGALLALPEGLLDLAHLGSLEVAELGGEALQAGAGEGDRGQQLGVAVAGNDLRGDVLGGEVETVPGRGPRTRGWWPRRFRPRQTPRRRSPARTPVVGGRGCGGPRRRSPRAAGRSSWARRGRRGYCPRSGSPICSRAREPRAPAPAPWRRRGSSSPASRSWSAEGRVEHVRGGEPEVDPAAGLARGGRRARPRRRPRRGR